MNIFKARIIAASLMLAASVASGHCAALSKGTLRVGAARADITPPAAMLPFHPMHEEHPYTAIHDSLYARAVVMDDGQRRAVLVEIDEVQVPDARAMISEVARKASTDPNAVIVCVSHTHSTLHPDGRDSRLQPVINRIHDGVMAAVSRAVESLRPASVAFTRTKANVNINNGEADGSRGQYSPDAYSDKTLDIVRFADEGGRAIALVVNYASHAEVMFRSVSRDGGFEISGDLPGRTAALLEHAPADGSVAGAAPVVLTTAGAEADQQPIFTSRQRTSSMGIVDQGAGGWAIVDALAHRLADAVNEAVEQMPQGETRASIAARSGEAIVPGQHRHGDRETGKITDEPAADVHIPVVRLQVGGVTFAGVGADLGASIGAALRANASNRQTMLITCIAGNVGYVLPDSMYAHYTHGVMGSPVRPGFAQSVLTEELNKQ